jgi:GTP cyclohydrolase I
MTSTLPNGLGSRDLQGRTRDTSRDILASERGDGLSMASTPVPVPVSLRIRRRLEEAGIPFLANDNIAAHIGEGELEQLQEEVTDRVRDLLRSLVIDIDNDHNTAETAERVARMYLQEVFKGRYLEQPKIACFPNVK